ncbi:MAG: hypothetical protein KatS3mg023_3600 [Armatimonadota bacterium]|nr:MAG: hypothetical protein KatS3mg023_3600 [Armatimonadota bacterium]
MRLAHISDCHLGFGRRGMRFAEQDVYRCFQTAMSEARQWADVILVTGDLFDNVRLDVDALRLAASEFSACKQPVVIVGGNHDVPAMVGVESPLSMLKEMCPSIHLAEREYQRFDVSGLEIHAVPARYLARWTEWIEPDSKWSVLAIHGVHAYSPMRPPGDAWLIPQLYDASRFRYVALGDLHDWHSLPTRYPPREYYAGSTAYCSSNIWSEQSPKGWLKVTIGTLLNVQFVRIKQRGWLTVELDLDSLESDPLIELEMRLNSALIEKLTTGAIHREPPVLRVIIRSADLNRLNQVESSIRAQKLPVSALYVVRRYRNFIVRHHIAQGDLRTRWINYVSSRLNELPKGVDAQEVIRRGLEALELNGDFNDALRVLVHLPDDDPDPILSGTS